MTSVLFIHGLESGPRGRKPTSLADAGFSVVSLQMPCGRDRALRDPAVLAAGALAAAGAGALVLRRPVFGALVAGALGYALAPVASAAIVRRMFDRSVSVQLRALSERRVDAVVASSFGGAVAIELLHRRAWSGPTVLLCPAHRLVAERARSAPPASLAALPEQTAERVLVVHGRSDETVPIEHSRALVQGTRAQLLEVEDDHRLTATATAEGLAGWLARVGVAP